MRIVHSETLKRHPDGRVSYRPIGETEPFFFSESGQTWVYCAMDSCTTKEIHPKVLSLLSDDAHLIYNFERACQAPALDLMHRGFLIDRVKALTILDELDTTYAELEIYLNSMAFVIWGDSLNPQSSDQMTHFFYEMPSPKSKFNPGFMFPPQYSSSKGRKHISCDAENLEKIRDRYTDAEPIVRCILAMRDINGQRKVFKSGISDDGRLHSSYNVGSTETGRWSSSKNVFGRGTNAQNVTPRMRRAFVSDPGFKLGNSDLSQAESFVVAYEAQDDSYIQACESGDLHTAVCRMVWPELAWGSRPDREIADQIFYRTFSYRDMTKRGGHALNYYAKAWTIAKSLKISKDKADEFNSRYFNIFSGIRRWHGEIQRELQSTARLRTCFGRERTFYGRLRDDATLREAIAFLPQSTVGDLLNLALYFVWLRHRDRIQLLAQVHDSIVYEFDYPYGVSVSSSTGLVEKEMKIPLTIHDRTFTIPVETKVGYDWLNLEKPGSEKDLGRDDMRDIIWKSTKTQNLLNVVFH